MKVRVDRPAAAPAAAVAEAARRTQGARALGAGRAGLGEPRRATGRAIGVACGCRACRVHVSIHVSVVIGSAVTLFVKLLSEFGAKTIFESLLNVEEVLPNKALPEPSIRIASAASPDIILLDWMMPLVSGIEVCRRLKLNRETREIPIIMLSARSEEVDKVRGLETGADDYMIKPYSVIELLARVRGQLRRTRAAAMGQKLRFEDIVLDAETFEVFRDNQPLKLGPTEFRLLSLFMEKPRRVWSRDQLLDRVWSRETDVETRTVDVHIGRLRKALCQNGGTDLLRTVRGAGYALG